MNVSRCALVASSLVLTGIPAVTTGQQYPARPIRLVVPVSPGATTDILARSLAAKLTDSLGQQVVVDNRGGASGVIGTETVARANPDGHTLLVITSTHTINPSLQRKLPYDPIRDFTPIAYLASSPTILITHNSTPAANVRELINLAKAKPGLTFGSGGTGSSTHLVAELFKSASGTEFTHVPYKGAGPALTDVLAGQLTFMFSGIVPAIPHVKGGRIRGLGVTSLKRTVAAPDVPTLNESGLPGFEFGLWYGLLGPAGLGENIVTRVERETRTALESSDVRNRLAAEGADVIAAGPKSLLAHMQAEIEKYRKLVRLAGIKPE
jgi:tripartite-type tricarboxylate transporter receptor subunit TctC